MPIIQSPNIGLRLKKLLSLTHLPDAVLAPEIVGVILVGDVSEGALVRHCQGSVVIPGVAAEVAVAALRNTPVSGSPRDVAVRVTKVTISSDAAQLLELRITGATLGTLTTVGDKRFTDLDQVGTPASEVGGQTRPVLPASGLLVPFLAGAAVMNTIDLDILFGTVAAGQFQNSLFVSGATVATGLQVGWFWDEFTPEPQ